MSDSSKRVGMAAIVMPKIIRALRPAKKGRIFRLFLLAGGALLALGIFATANWFLGHCYRIETIGPALCKRLLDIVLLALSSVLLLSNVVSAIGSFFLADDLELLLTAPLNNRSFFAARFSEQLLHSSWMVVAFGIPVLLAFCRVAGTPMTYLWVILCLFPLLVIPAAIGALITLLMVRALPAMRVRDIVLVLAVVAFLVLYMVVRGFQPERFLKPEGFSSMVSLLSSLSQSQGSLLPSGWATAVIAHSFEPSVPTESPWRLFATLYGVALAAYGLAFFAHHKLYAIAYSRSQQGGKVARVSRFWSKLKREQVAPDGEIRSPQRLGASADWLRAAGRVFPRGVAREFLVKDLKLLFRDASQWSQFLLLLAIVFVYLYNFRYFRDLGDDGLVGPLAIFLVGLTLCSFVTTAVSVRFAFPLVSIEGRMLWLLKTAPVTPAQILRSKLAAAIPPLFVIGEGMSIASSLMLGVRGWMLVLGAIVAALTSLSVAGISIGLGGLWPDFRAETAGKVASSINGLICMAVSMFVAFILLGWAAYPAFALHYRHAVSPFLLLVCGLGL